jgi:hypothetical protein
MTLGNGEQMEVMARIILQATLLQLTSIWKRYLSSAEGQFAAWYEDELVGSELFLRLLLYFLWLIAINLFFCFINWLLERTVLSNVKFDHENIYFYVLVQSFFSQEDAWVYFNAKSDSQSYLDSPLNML